MHDTRARLRKVLQQPRLAHAGLARHSHHLARAPSLLQRPRFRVAADQARRAQHRRRHGARAERRRRGGGLPQRVAQGLRLCRRCHAKLPPQQPLAAFVGLQCRRAVTGQIVDLHQPPVRGFGHRLQRQQLGGGKQRLGPIARLLGRLDAVHQRLPRAQPAVLAALRQPGVELTADRRVTAFKHRRRSRQVVPQPIGQRQRDLAADELGAKLPAQLEQALAKRVAPGFFGAVRPQQPRQAVARGRAFQRQPGQQSGVARGQRQACAVVTLHTGATGQLQVHGRSIW